MDATAPTGINIGITEQDVSTARLCTARALGTDRPLQGIAPASAIFVYDSDTISGQLGGFHCSFIDPIVVVVMLGRVVVLIVVIVLMVLRP
jgi:hypothetical protein